MNNQPMIITNCDISSQEPTWVILLSKEKSYFPVFRNKALRELGLNIYIDRVIGNNFNFDPEEYSTKSHIYWTWLHKRFNWNWVELYKFNVMVDKLKSGDESVKDEMTSVISVWIDELDKVIKD